MGTGPVTIDLGELPRGGGPEPDLQWSPHRRLRRYGRLWRGVGAVTAVVLLPLSAAAASGPPVPVLQHQFTITQIWGAVLDDDRIYTIETRTGGAGSTLVAYWLDGGAVAWEAQLPAGADDAWLSMVDGMPLLTFYWELTWNNTLLDPESGEQRWSHDGALIGNVAGLALFSRSEFSSAEDQHDIDAVDLATGSTVWTLALPRTAYAFDLTRLVALEPDGRLISYDLATGEVLATVSTNATDSTDVADLYVADPLAFVIDRGRSGPSLSAYNVDSLAQQWSVTVAGNQLPPWPIRCGSLVCLVRSGATPRAVDPVTGEVVWSADWLPVHRDTWVGIQIPPDGPLAGFLVLSSSSEEDGERSWVVDGRTGEPVLDLQRWQIAPSRGVSPPGSAAPMLTWHDGEVSWLGRLRPDLSAVDPLGAIAHPRSQNCTLDLPQVLCWTYGGESERQDVDVWRARW